MEKLHHKLSITKKGFSLIEIVAALFILSSSIMILYNLILSTNISILNLDNHYHSKEVANNRIAMIHTIEKPLAGNSRKGYMKMGAKEWQWEESFEPSENEELIKYQIFVKEKGASTYSYKTEGFLINE